MVQGVVGEGREVVQGVVGEGRQVVQGVVGEGREVVQGVVGEGREVVQGVGGEERGVVPGVVGDGDMVVPKQGNTQEDGSSVSRASVYRSGTIGGTQVNDVVLDTGCAHTIVHRTLVPEDRHLPGQAITLRCVHGDTVLYPLAEVEIEVSGVVIRVLAAVSDTLPVSVLLGTDVPELGLLLKQDPSGLHTTDVEEVLVVTRAQAKTQTREEQLRVHAEKMSGVQATPVEPEPSSSLTDTPESSLEGGGDLANELFEEHPSRPKLTRQEKRRDRHARGLERAKDPKPAKVMGASPLGVQAFHVYLMGRPFLIQTDHRSLEWLNRLKDTNARLTRWSLFLQGYSYEVKYRSGQSNGNADALSRAW